MSVHRTLGLSWIMSRWSHDASSRSSAFAAIDGGRPAFRIRCSHGSSSPAASPPPLAFRCWPCAWPATARPLASAAAGRRGGGGVDAAALRALAILLAAAAAAAPGARTRRRGGGGDPARHRARRPLRRRATAVAARSLDVRAVLGELARQLRPPAEAVLEVVLPLLHDRQQLDVVRHLELRERHAALRLQRLDGAGVAQIAEVLQRHHDERLRALLLPLLLREARAVAGLRRHGS